MKKKIKAIFKIHSWIGLITGILLFIISISGTLIVFYDEIDLFFDNELLRVRPEEKKVSLNDIYAKVKTAYPDASAIRYRRLPHAAHQSIEMNVVKEGVDLLVYVNPYSSEMIGERERFSFLIDWFLKLHYSLFLEETGEITVAILALLLMFSIITGAIVYKKYLLKALFFQVPLKMSNWRTASSSLHRLVGVWSLVFNFIIAITGFYMLYPVLLPSGEEGEKVKTVTTPVNLMLSIEDLLSKSKISLPGFLPYSITIPNNSNDPIKIFGSVPDKNPLSPVYSSYIHFHQTTGEVTEVYDIRKQSFLNQLDHSMYSLHFGNYGGLIVKVLYSIFGFTPSILSITGFLLWWRRNKKRKYKNEDLNKYSNRKFIATAEPMEQFAKASVRKS